MTEAGRSLDGLSAAALSCPYKGLTYYTERDADFFFGRERERQVITANLTASRLTLLYGESGVGKSSLLRAGVAHRLRERAQRRIDQEEPPEFVPVVFSEWRDDPIAGLRRAVRTAVEPYAGDRAAALDESVDRLERILSLGADAADATLLLILDQFEDYFLYHSAERGEGTFAADFPRAVKDGSLRANFLIGIREDAYAQLDFFKGQIPTLFENYLRIQHLSRDAARSAIEKPIAELNRRAGEGADQVEIEPELVEAVLDQVRTGALVLGPAGEGRIETNGSSASEERIEAPYLQLVLERLWNEELGSGSRVLRLATLRELGGADRIVKQHVDEALTQLSESERDLAASVFRQLVTRGGTKIAHTAADLADFAEMKPEQVRPLLEKLSGEPARILRPVAAPPDQSDGLRYEIYHDVLGPAILDWRTRESLRLKEEEARRERARARTFRSVAVVAGALALVASALAVVAWNQQQTGRSKRIAAESSAMLSVDPAASVGLAAKALDVKVTAEADDALRRALSESRLRVVLRGHGDWVNGAAFSPDGTRAVTASEDGTARLWNTRSGRTLVVMRHGSVVTGAAFSPDGRHVATASDDDRARVWDAATGRQAGPGLRHQGDVLWVTFSPDGRRLLTAGEDRKVRVWQWRSGRGRVVARLAAPVRRALFVPRTRSLALAVVDDGSVRLIDISSGEEVGAVDRVGAVTSAAFDRAGRLLVIGLENGTAQTWELSRSGGSTLRFRNLLGGHTRGVADVAFSPDGRLVLTASDDGTVRVWEPDLERVLAELRGHSDSVTSAAFRSDGAEIVTASGDGTARIWTWRDRGTVEFRGHGYGVESARFSRDGRLVVTAGKLAPDGTAKAIVWTAAGELRVALSRSDWLGVSEAEFDPSGRRVALATAAGEVWVFDAERGVRLADARMHGTYLTSVSFSPDGRTIATTAADGTAALWPWREAGAAPRTWTAHGDWAYDASFSPDGRYIATTGDDGLALVWNVSGRRPRLERKLAGHRGAVNTAMFDPTDPSRLLTASGDGTARIWRWRDGKVVLTIRDETQITSAAFDAAAQRVLTTGADGRTRVWNASSGRILAVLRRHADIVTSGAFSPDGSSILTSSGDRTAKLYPCPTCRPLGELRALAERWKEYAERRVR